MPFTFTCDCSFWAFFSAAFAAAAIVASGTPNAFSARVLFGTGSSGSRNSLASTSSGMFTPRLGLLGVAAGGGFFFGVAFFGVEVARGMRRFAFFHVGSCFSSRRFSPSSSLKAKRKLYNSMPFTNCKCRSQICLNAVHKTHSSVFSRTHCQPFLRRMKRAW